MDFTPDYSLTFLRIFVLWSLAVIFLLMAGVTISIYMNRFPLFTYSMIVVTVFYIGLSFAHPDYWIAKYNLNPEHMEYLDDYDTLDSQKYLGKLSADAAPIILSEKNNPYFADFTDIIDQDGNVHEEYSWLSRYNNRMRDLSEEMHIRNFNFSVHTAERHVYWY